MSAKKLKEELDKFKRSYKLIVARNVELENQFQKQEERIAVLTQSIEECQRALDMNKKLMHQLGEEHNRKEHELVTFMNALKAKLREMGYNASFDNLGNKGH